MKMASKTYAVEILSKIKDRLPIKMYTIDNDIRKKNLQFMKKYNISFDDVKDYLYSLEPKHFKAKIKTEDSNIKSKYLYEFTISTSILNEYATYDYVNIYIKIGYIEVNNSEVIVVSFHD